MDILILSVGDDEKVVVISESEIFTREFVEDYADSIVESYESEDVVITVDGDKKVY